MRAATKQWLFLILLAATLAVLVALAIWQMAKARREAPARPDPSRPAPVSQTPPRGGDSAAGILARRAVVPARRDHRASAYLSRSGVDEEALAQGC